MTSVHKESGRPSNKTNSTQGNLFILLASMDDDRESKALMLRSSAILLKKKAYTRTTHTVQKRVRMK